MPRDELRQPLRKRSLGERLWAKRPSAFATVAVSVIALFAGERQATLPLMVQRLAGAYRMEAAGAAALLLVALSFALFWAFDRLGARHADA